MSGNWVLIKKYDDVIKADYLVSKYPVSRKEFLDIASSDKADPSPESGKYIQRTTWMDAVKYCNRLSEKKGLPLAYDEKTGMLINTSGNPVNALSDVQGVRLPSSEEWEYASKGWVEKKSGLYLRILAATYKFWDQDSEVYTHGLSELEKLETNTLGLRGILGNAHEWYSDCKTSLGIKNKLCYWDDYIANYDNDISYQVKTRVCHDADLYGFRVVLTW